MKKITIECPKCKKKTFVVPLQDSGLSSIAIKFEDDPKKFNELDIEVRKGKCKNRTCNYSKDEDELDLLTISRALANGDYEDGELKMQMLPMYLREIYEYHFYNGCLNYFKRYFMLAAECFSESRGILLRKLKRAKSPASYVHIFWIDYFHALSLIGAKEQDQAREFLRDALKSLRNEKDASQTNSNEGRAIYALFEFSLEVLSLLSGMKVRKDVDALRIFEDLKKYFLSTGQKSNLSTTEEIVNYLSTFSPRSQVMSQFRIVRFFIISQLIQKQFTILFETVLNQMTEDRKLEELQWFEEMLSTYMPTKTNKLGNSFWYWPLKFKLNELQLEYYVCRGELDSAFEYVETNGVDFVTQHRHGYMEIAPEDIPDPFKFTYEDWGQMYAGLDQWENMVDLEWYRPLKEFYIPAQMYWEYLKNPRIAELAGSEIKHRIFELARRDVADDYCLRITYPVYVAQIAEEELNFDEAIQFFNKSHIDPTGRAKAIERCRLLRDGIRYEELRGVLRTLNAEQQRQLVAYSEIFSLESRLRNVVVKSLQAKHGGTKWWETHVDPEIRKKCDQRFHDWMSYHESPELAREICMIEFTTLNELKAIILEEKNWKNVFKVLFHNKTRFDSILNLLEPIRNDVAHARLLSQEQYEDLSKNIKKLDNRLREIEQTFEREI